MDPGNYSTAVSAGALYEYKLLFIVLVSNIFAVFLQILCTKLGSVTGLDLAQNCREHLPRWLCITIYVLAEIAIIATDLAEVVGTAISLNILLNIPLPLGVVVTVIDVLLVLMAYRPNGGMKIVRYFEYMVSALVLVVVICFAIELSSIGPVDTGAIFRGFLPSKELTDTQGLYLSCGILGATVMPHSLYLGSGIVQPRLREYDIKHGHYSPDEYEPEDGGHFRPSIHAIKYCMNYSIAELVVSLFTVAIFINAAILIVAGATLAGSPDAVDADLFSIYQMLVQYLGKVAATVFALALLFSGQSAGIVCTLAGQIVSEGFLHWSFQPWIRRLITRGIAIAPCLLVSVFMGRKGLADVLNGSQVCLSLLLPFVSAPLIYFTCNKKIMRVECSEAELRSGRSREGYSQLEDNDASGIYYKDMSNGWITNVIAIIIFVLVSGLNAFLIVSMALGADVHF
jgi:metal iron transporter